MKTKYSIEIINLGHQPDHKTTKNFQLFQENVADPDNARLFLIIIRQRKLKLISN